MKIIGVRGSPISRENLFIAFSPARVQDYDFIAGIAPTEQAAGNYYHVVTCYHIQLAGFSEPSGNYFEIC